MIKFKRNATFKSFLKPPQKGAPLTIKIGTSSSYAGKGFWLNPPEADKNQDRVELT